MKVTGWREILYNELAKSSNTCFKWGENDCVKWSLGILRKTTTDPLPFGISWTNKREALLALKEKSLKSRIIEYLGEPKPITYALCGDLVMRDDEEVGEMLGICVGSYCVFLSKKGLRHYSLLECQYSWSIL